jgi:caffeoyl-CoA O-methyltransferase
LANRVLDGTCGGWKMNACSKINTIFIACLLFMAAACDYGMSSSDAPQPPKFSSLDERHAWVIKKYLPWMESYSWTYANVPHNDGRFLYDLIVKTQRKSALEMGSANGYSAIWIGMAMEKTGGRLITIELDKEKAGLCRGNLRNVGLSTIVKCINGDALLVAASLEGRFDFLFVDIGPVDALPFFEAAEKILDQDFIIALHNVGFAGNYENMFAYAKSKGWTIKSRRTNDGEGFFLITPEPLDI